MSEPPHPPRRSPGGRRGRGRVPRDPLKPKPAMARPPSVVGMIFFTAFLILPGMAVWRVAHQIDWRVVLLYLVALSLATLVLYRFDKQAAQNRGWRTPETVLHLAEIGGGWAAAYVAQQVFRHKTSKLGYKVIFWSIGFLHQCFALDFLMDWRISRGVFG